MPHTLDQGRVTPLSQDNLRLKHVNASVSRCGVSVSIRSQRILAMLILMQGTRMTATAIIDICSVVHISRDMGNMRLQGTLNEPIH